MKCYEKSAKLDSRYADPVNNIGTVWYERKKYSKAIRATNGYRIKDDFASFYMNLGTLTLPTEVRRVHRFLPQGSATRSASV